MSFTIYPAIDLRGGKCVRLVQGDYYQETIYGEDPVQMALNWEKQGADWLHLVDLDAAKTGEPTNLAVIEQIVEALSIPVQVGGGIRNMERLEYLLSRGVARVIIGSAAVDQPDFVKGALHRFPENIAIGIDARDGKVATHGWLKSAQVTAEELAQEMVKYGAERFIFTDIARDGMLSGVNLAAIRQLAQACGKEVIASGGVRSMEDLKTLAVYQQEGITGAIVGKALYTGHISLMEAQQWTKGARAE